MVHVRSMYGQELARVDGMFYDDFAPATFHLSAGRRQNQYLKDRPEITALERDALLQAVRNMESYAVLDEYLDMVRLSKEDVLRGQEHAHVKLLREKYGPTALMNSVNTVQASKYLLTTPVLNLRFPASVWKNARRQGSLRGMIESYFQEGGMQLQINVCDAEILRAAVKEPGKYRSLVVRVGGYSDYFVNLSAKLQQEIILRTEHRI